MTGGKGIAWRQALLPGALAALAVTEVAVLDAPGRVAAAALLVAGCALLLVRARWAVCSTGAGLLALAVPWVGPELDEVATIPLVLVVASYALARWVTDLRGLAGVAVILVGTALTYAVVDERAHGADDAVLVLALTLPPYVGGRLARRLADHNALLRREQELLRRRAILDERDRISRELHDVVAHSISAMVVQVAAAEDLLVTDPDRAEEMLDRAGDAGRTALAETGRLLRFLRDSDNELGLATGTRAGDDAGQLVGSGR